MNTSEKAEFAASICHIARFSKSRIPILSSKLPDKTGRKTRTQAIAECYSFHTNAKNPFVFLKLVINL